MIYGSFSNVSTTSLAGMRSLSFNSSGTLYALTDPDNVGSFYLDTIDTSAGTATHLSKIITDKFLRAIAFDYAGSLRVVGHDPDNANFIATIDPNSGAVSNVLNITGTTTDITGIEYLTYSHE